MRVDVQKGCDMGLAWRAPPVWPATTALRASVAFEEVRMRYAKPYWMVFMPFRVPNMQ